MNVELKIKSAFYVIRIDNNSPDQSTFCNISKSCKAFLINVFSSTAVIFYQFLEVVSISVTEDLWEEYPKEKKNICLK